VGHADIAIVGAGIVGCMIAREIASRAPEAAVVVLDRDTIGCGASRRSAGLHIPRGTTDRLRRMAAYSQGYYEKLKEVRPSLPIHPLGMSVVASEASARHLQEAYLDCARLVRADDTRSPLIRVPEHAGVWHGEGCQYADVQALTQALAQELRPRISFREGVHVAAIGPTAGSVVLELGTGDALTVEQVVLAPGPWLTAPAWKELVAPLGVRAKKVIALHIEQSPSERDGAIVFQDEDAFLLPLLHRGHWLFSYTCQEWDVEPDAVLDGLSPHNVEEARDCLRHYAPTLVKHCAGGRVFCDAYSSDREPQVHVLDGAGRVVFAGAANGSGYRLAPAIASEAADLLAHTIRP
jgi:glycine/D-amino acid oxidase-like deaminating enzyme